MCVIIIIFGVCVIHKNGGRLDQAPAWEAQVVPVSFGAGSGNAVILEKSQECYILCTAAHVVGAAPQSGLVSGSKPGEGSVSGSESVQGLVDGKPVSVQEYYVSPNVDVAFLKISAQFLEGKEHTGQAVGPREYLPAGLDSAAYNELLEADPLYIFGFLGGEQQTYEGQVLSCWIYMEDFGYHMLWGQASEVKSGMSGSGVFDENGQLIGILCGGNGTDQVAVLPVSIIEAEWKNSKMEER